MAGRMFAVLANDIRNEGRGVRAMGGRFRRKRAMPLLQPSSFHTRIVRHGKRESDSEQVPVSSRVVLPVTRVPVRTARTHTTGTGYCFFFLDFGYSVVMFSR